MNSFLLSVGIAIAAALIAALVAPLFIDWGGYRSFFEARASAMLGAPVRIEGDLSARLLPNPRIVASDVTIGEEGGFHASGLRLRVGLTPLLSGSLQVEQVRIEGADLRMAIDSEGRVSGLKAPQPQDDGGDVSLEAIEISGATLTLEKPGGEDVFGNIDLTASATGLDGPYKAAGTFSHRGEVYDLNLATGRWSEAGELRTRLSLTPRGQPVAFDADGTLRLEAAVPAFAGRVRLERVADANTDGIRWQFQGDAQASPSAVRFTSLKIGFGPQTRQFTLEGAGSLSLGGGARFDAVLGARQADLDRALGTGEEETLALTAALSRIGALLRTPPPVPGRLGVDLARVVLAGNIIDDLSFAVEWTGNQWRLEEASARLPGDTRIGLAGELVPGNGNGAPVAFDGAVRLDTARGHAFADWLGAEFAPYTGWLDGAVDARADLAYDASRLRLDNIDTAVRGRRVTGAIAADLPGPGKAGALRIDLAGEEIRLATLRALWMGLRSGGGGDHGPDLSLKLAADAVTADAATARDVQIDAAFAGGKLDLRKLQVGDLGGAKLAADGTLDLGADGRDGRLGFSVEAKALDGAAAFIGQFGFEGIAAGLAARAQALSPLSLKGEVNASGGATALSLSGTAAGTQVTAGGTLDGALEAPSEALADAEIDLRADDARELFAQLGFEGDAGVGGPAQVAMRLGGVARKGLKVDASVSAAGADLGAKGTVRFDEGGGRTLDLAVSARSRQAGKFLAALGIRQPPKAGDDLPGRLDAKVSGRNPFALSGIALDLGEGADAVSMTGSGTLDWGDQPRIAADLKGNALSLPAVLNALCGSDSFAAGGQTAFSAKPFAVSLPQSAALDARLDLDRLTLVPGLVLTGAEVKLGLGPDGIRLGDFAGSAFGGEAGGSVSVKARGGEVTADGRLHIEDARLSDVVWRRGGRAVASGSFTADMNFQGGGRSLAALVASLSGQGTVSVKDGSILGLSPVAFDEIVAAWDRGTEIDAARAEELLAAYLDAGTLDFGGADMSFSVAGGVARATRFAIDGEGLTSFATGQLDLNDMTLESVWSVRAPPDAQKRAREFGIVFEGPADAPERSFDAAPLISYLTIRAFEEDMQRLEAIQGDIHERGRLRREMNVIQDRRRAERQAAAERERQQRARKAAAARRAREEAARKAAEAAAKPPILSQPIEIAPPPGSDYPPQGQALGGDPFLSGDTGLPEPLPGTDGAAAAPTRKGPRIDPLSGFGR